VFRPLVPMLWLVVPATAVLSAPIEIVQAAEECRARPDSTAPADSGWYYRVDRANHRRCWFLRKKNANAQFTGHRHFAADITGGVRQEERPAARPQITPSQIELADDALPAARTTIPQAAAPTDDAATKYLIPRSVSTVSFRKQLPDQQTPLESIFKAAREAEQTSTGVDNSLAMLSEAAATSLLVVGGSLLLTHLLRRKSRKQAFLRDPQIADRCGVPVVRAPPTASRLSNTPRVAADDFTTSLRELRRNLRRAEASIQGRSGEYTFSNRSRESAF
jgi:hypothetical protein